MEEEKSSDEKLKSKMRRRFCTNQRGKASTCAVAHLCGPTKPTIILIGPNNHVIHDAELF